MTEALTWRIDWHEGEIWDGKPNGRFADTEYETEEALGVALRAIGSEESLRHGGYNKTGVSLLVDGDVIWSERLDQNAHNGENTRPRQTWREYASFYATERGHKFATSVRVDAAARAAYYNALLSGDWEEARRQAQLAERRPA